MRALAALLLLLLLASCLYQVPAAIEAEAHYQEAVMKNRNVAGEVNSWWSRELPVEPDGPTWAEVEAATEAAAEDELERRAYEEAFGE